MELALCGQVTYEDFQKVRRDFEMLGSKLSDDQLLELADIYHAILRLRRHPVAKRENPSFAHP